MYAVLDFTRALMGFQCGRKHRELQISGPYARGLPSLCVLAILMFQSCRTINKVDDSPRTVVCLLSSGYALWGSPEPDMLRVFNTLDCAPRETGAEDCIRSAVAIRNPSKHSDVEATTRRIWVGTWQLACCSFGVRAPSMDVVEAVLVAGVLAWTLFSALGHQ
jgi:hypothetical protein